MLRGLLSSVRGGSVGVDFGDRYREWAIGYRFLTSGFLRLGLGAYCSSGGVLHELVAVLVVVWCERFWRR